MRFAGKIRKWTVLGPDIFRVLTRILLNISYRLEFCNDVQLFLNLSSPCLLLPSLLGRPSRSCEELLLLHFSGYWTGMEGVDICEAFVRVCKAGSTAMVDGVKV